VGFVLVALQVTVEAAPHASTNQNLEEKGRKSSVVCLEGVTT